MVRSTCFVRYVVNIDIFKYNTYRVEKVKVRFDLNFYIFIYNEGKIALKYPCLEQNRGITDVIWILIRFKVRL